MRTLFIALLQGLVLIGGTAGWAADEALEWLLRAQAFNPGV